MTDAPEAQETADEVARAVERLQAAFPLDGYGFSMSYRETAPAIETILSRLAVLEEERRLDGESLKQADVALANVTAFEDDARYIMGNTNFEITKHCRDEIRARLQARKDNA